jgi:ubiquinone/menaquinone biosynthesis C-methylase UbiE
MNRWEALRNPFGAYLDDLLSHMPARCQSALDVGCGVGELTRRIASMSDEVLGIDRAENMIDVARRLSAEVSNVSFQLGDFLSAELPDEAYDFVLSVASIHHMDFNEGLNKMATVARPGGVVAVLGLANESAPLDYIASALGAVQLHSLARGQLGGTNVHNMPVLDATMTYREVATQAQKLLPGVRYRRRPVFRYSLIWRKPG